MARPDRNAPCPCGSGKKYKKCCGAVPRAAPADGPALLERARAAFDSGRFEDARGLCLELVQRHPEQAEVNHVCGVVQYRCGDAGEARRLLEKAVKLLPRDALPRSNLVLVLQGLGDLEAAERYGREAVALDPDLADAHNNLGNVLKARGRTDEALTHYRAAVARDPHNPPFQINLGSLLQAQGRHEQEAEAAYRRAIELAPAWAPAHASLGALCLQWKRLDEAREALHKALSLDPGDAETLNNLGLVLQGLGQLDEALAWFDRAIARNPGSAGAHSNRGLVLEEKGDDEGAVRAYEQALACNPEFYSAHQNLLGILVNLGRVDRAHPLACDLLETPAALETVLPIVIDVLGQACDFGRRDRAWRLFEQYREAGRLRPETLLKAVFSGNYVEAVSEETLAGYHRAAGEYLESRAAPEKFAYRAGDAGGRLKLGYLSPDFRQHPVGYFIQHVIAAHDPSRFEVYCYSNSRKRDDLTDFIRAHAGRFTTVAGLSDEALARAIHEDGVDILVDLAGHTSGNRLAVLAHRPAPVQMTWIGYLNTTGLNRVDYRITDPHADSQDGTGGTEKLLRLPECFLCFGAFPECAIEPAAPFQRNGFVTFASFNNLMKLTARAVRLWADILRRVEGARLVIMALGAGGRTVRAHVHAEFERHGVSPERVQLHEPLPRRDYLGYHNQVDIMLDTFPYNGGTVSCGALWMGVPVVTLVGPAHRQRVSYSLLKNIGLDETIAHTEGEYVDIAARLATDPAALNALRRALPERVRRSILCDPARFTRQLEQACLRAWQDRSEARNPQAGPA